MANPPRNGFPYRESTFAMRPFEGVALGDKFLRELEMEVREAHG